MHTDTGRRKKINQDSMLVLEAETDRGNILFAAVCDGMGGLSKGETASAAMIRAFVNWFRNDLPALIDQMRAGARAEDRLRDQWTSLIEETSRRIEAYGRDLHIELGTTASALLLWGGNYYTLNVGDSRVYLLADRICQLTKDQTYVQRELDAGRMTYEESLTDPMRNVLLQCIGAGGAVSPVFSHGKTAAGQVFLLCSDGFRHVVTPQELFERMNSQMLTDEKTMKDTLIYFTELNKNRRETDNITALLVRVD